MFQRLEKFIFYALIFSIPFQTRVVLRSWGVGFNEWNSAFFYFTDLLILAVLGLWFLRIVLKRGNFAFSNYDWFLVGFLVVSAVSITNASNQTLEFYQLMKLAEFSLLYFYMKSNFGIIFPGSENSENNYMTAKPYSEFLLPGFVFLASGFFQAVLAIIQYVRQADLGLRFLGETVLNQDLFNVAVFMADGEKIMRPYGTLPHPNVLAFFLFIAVFIYYFFYIEKNRFFHSKSGLVFYSVSLFGFLLTFSRIIIFVWAVGAGLRWLIFNNKFSGVAESPNLKKIIIATFTVLILFSVIFWPQVLARLNISGGDEAVQLRGYYNKVALSEKPFFGVGAGNFVNWFKETNPGLSPSIYQPVHNIYLLVFSETGILGLAAFSLFLGFLIRNFIKVAPFNRPFHYSLMILFVSFLFFGLFDHFLWTLQQSRIILFLAAGLMSTMRPYSSIG